MSGDDELDGLFAPAVRRQSIALLTTVALSAFQALAVSAALPSIAADLGDVSLLPWVISSYLLASGVATVAAGALVDRLGVAPVFRGSIALFVLGGTLAGFVPSMPLLVAARVVHGLGSGAVIAVSLAAVNIVYPSRLVSRAFAANTTVWGVMGVAGPALAAALLVFASWRWIFLVSIPLGGTALLLGWRTLPASAPDRPAGTATPRLDPVVLVLLTVVSGGLLYAVDALDWTSLPALLATCTAAWFALARQRGRADALVAPRHVIDAPLGPLALTAGLVLAGGIGLNVFMPLYLSAGRGVRASTAAWSVVFFTVGWTAGANISSRLVERRPPLSVVGIGVALMPASLVVCATGVFLDVWSVVLFVVAVVCGSAAGMTTNACLTVLGAVTPAEELGRATAAHQFVRNNGFALGNAMVGAVILFVVAATSGDVDVVADVLAGAAEGVGPAALTEVSDSVRSGYGTGVAIGAVVAATAWIPLRKVSRVRPGTAGAQANTQRS